MRQFETSNTISFSLEGYKSLGRPSWSWSSHKERPDNLSLEVTDQYYQTLLITRKLHSYNKVQKLRGVFRKVSIVSHNCLDSAFGPIEIT